MQLDNGSQLVMIFVVATSEWGVGVLRPPATILKSGYLLVFL